MTLFKFVFFSSNYFSSLNFQNYAREIMQLFSIGLYKLNQDGTKVIDEETGKPAETYTNEDIMTFARAWTNFQRREFRPNLEVFSDFIFSDNEERL